MTTPDEPAADPSAFSPEPALRRDVDQVDVILVAGQHEPTGVGAAGRHVNVVYGGQGQVALELDGQRISVTEGRSIAAALLEVGVPALRHSHFLGQPRGLFCGDGRCGECRMTVDGVPGVRTCLVPTREGQRIDTGGVDESTPESIGQRAPK